MTVQLNIKKVLALPGTFDPSTIYFVQGAEAGQLEIYVSSNDGSSVRHVITKSEVATMIANALSGMDSVQIVADITARDAMSPTVITQVLVLDASDDPTVTGGAATYVYDPNTTSWIKINEAESMDVVLQWSNIIGGPSSSPADIDDAVTKRHAHSNKTVLDSVDQSGGFLTYDGRVVGNFASTSEW